MNQCVNFSDIESERLMITPLRPDHADGLFKPFSDPLLYTYIFWEAPKEVASLRDKFERICVGHSPDKKQIWLNWAATMKTSGDYSGFFEATITGQEAMLAYFTFKPFQRLGLAKEGVTAVMNYLKSQYPIRTFIVEMDTRNRESVRLAEALGFKWVKTIDNACELKGYQSHEFRYELEI